MSRLAIRPEAIADLESIEDHIALDDVDQALAFIERLYEAMTLLAGQPLMGRARPELGVDIRSFPVGRYVIFYQPILNGMDVVRVLSGARDIDAAFLARDSLKAEVSNIPGGAQGTGSSRHRVLPFDIRWLLPPRETRRTEAASSTSGPPTAAGYPSASSRRAGSPTSASRARRHRLQRHSFLATPQRYASVVVAAMRSRGVRRMP